MFLKQSAEAEEEEYKTCNTGMKCKNYCVERGFRNWNCFNGKCRCMNSKLNAFFVSIGRSKNICNENLSFFKKPS